MMLVRLMLHRRRLLIGSWLVLLLALCTVTISAYGSTYPTAAERAVAVRLAQDNTATTLLYGRLADPGTPGQMFAWEIGAFATVLAAIMAVLLAVALTRAAEDDGTVELVRSCGIGKAAPLRAAVTILAEVALVLAVGCAVGVWLAAGPDDGVGASGAPAFGLVVGLTFLLVALLTAVLAQLAPSAGAARVFGFAALGVAFAVRAAADGRDAGWANWLSPLALRATIRPMDGARWWPLPLYVLLAALLVLLAAALHARREHGAGLLRRRDRRDTHLRIRSGFAFCVRLARHSVLTWTIAVACIGTLFGAMGSGVVGQSEHGDVGGFLGAQLGTGDPLAGFFAYTATVVGIMVAAFAVLGVLRARHDEASGLTDHVLATGARRWQPLLWQAAVTAAGCAVILVATGLCGALVAPTVFTGTDVALRAFAYPVGQWPATAAAVGWTTLLVGWLPRATWLAWLPLIASEPGEFILVYGKAAGCSERDPF